VEDAQTKMEKEIGQLSGKVEILTRKEEVEEKIRKDVEKRGDMEKRNRRDEERNRTFAERISRDGGNKK
jgi:hypothetical protein